MWQKCKMTPRLGSCMAGIFTILITIQSLILDLNQTFSMGKEPNKVYVYKDIHGMVFWVFSQKNNITIFLSFTTILASCFLLYSVHMQLYLGLLTYILWIITYEITCFSIVLLVTQVIKAPFLSVKYVLWINQLSRMVLHVFWLPFVVSHAYNLFKTPHTNIAKKGPRTKNFYESGESWSQVDLERKFT